MNISPTGWARKRGMIFSSHHDAPVAFPDSMRVLDATVTRRARGSGRIVGPEQRVDVITALKAMTIWPAYHHFEEKTKGSLEPGKLADFAILSKDPTAVEPTTIADIKVTETVKDGKTIFRLEPGAQADSGVPDITPLLVAFGGHRGRPDGCAHGSQARAAVQRGDRAEARRCTALGAAFRRMHQETEQMAKEAAADPAPDQHHRIGAVDQLRLYPCGIGSRRNRHGDNRFPVQA
jgi:hypothetical protein